MDVRLVNISKARVQNVDHNAPLISISDSHSGHVPVPNETKRPLLRLSFFPGDNAMPGDEGRLMTVERARQVAEFVEEQRKAGAQIIYVQCGEGRIRSWTICTTVAHRLDGFTHDSDNGCIKSGIVDRYTHRMMSHELISFAKQLDEQS